MKRCVASGVNIPPAMHTPALNSSGGNIVTD